MNDAQFWKNELFREVRRIQDVLQEPEFSKQLQTERFAFVTAYIMRKLAEGDALTQDITQSKWEVTQYPGIVPPPRRPWFRVSSDLETWRQPLEEHYDLTASRVAKLPFLGVCNNLVHHFAFAVRNSGAGLEMLFNSWDTRNRLFSMPLDTYIAMVEEVHYDEIRWVDLDRMAGRVIQRRQRPPFA